ncbi:MAG: hypothetical protein EAY75_11865 [Bacteroidetes bacterium]|nr:MAG: hypothetical protein EAY75_11865 [Bacteroidota bacterium]
MGLKNVGNASAEEVVQVYLSIENKNEQMPVSTLLNFKRVAVKKGATNQVSFSIPYNEFSYINSKGEKVQHQGKATLTVGNASPGQRSQELGANAFTMEVEL